MKTLTNEQRIKMLFKELEHPYMQIILRERLVTVADITRKGVKENPEAYFNPIFNYSWYLHFCTLVDNLLGFDKPRDNDNEVTLQTHMANMRAALKAKDKRTILNTYDLVKSLDFSCINILIAKQYDKLVTKCNTFLYS